MHTRLAIKRLLAIRWVTNIMKATGIVILSVVLTGVFLQPLQFSVATVLASEDKEELTVTDFYNALANSRHVRELNRQIVVINARGLSRSQTASLLNTVAIAEPAVVGLDVVYDEPHDDDPDADSRLIEAISAIPVKVLPVVLSADSVTGRFGVSESSFIYPLLDDCHLAAVNLPTHHSRGLVRQFRVQFPLEVQADTLDSFALAVAAEFAPEEAYKCTERGNTLETINYPSEEFQVLQPDEVEPMAEMLTDKIVLIGAIDDPADLHATPTTSLMSGVLVHAHAISTIINSKYFNEVSPLTNQALALGLCFFFALLSVSIPAGVKGIVNRLVQVSLLYCIVLAGYRLFIVNGVIVDFSYSFMMIAFGLFSADIWIGLTTIGTIMWHKWGNRLQRLHARHGAPLPDINP